MKKVKMDVSHSILDSLSNHLQILIANVPPVTDQDRVNNALWIECWLIIQEKAAFSFQGEKKLSLSVARAVALMMMMKKVKGATDYERTMYLSLIGTIDQQTA
jgi:hypothetical protein